MTHYCHLDLLPIELLHILFTYFPAHEILLSFSGVSDYIDGVLVAYPTWRLNFKSIRRDHFDLVCRRIQPEKVISLILSDDCDTPGQSELFFSRYQIEQFTHLQSLTLIKIEFESMESIFFNLGKLKHLSSLSFEGDSITYKYPSRINDSSDELRRIRLIVFYGYSQTLPHINRLHLHNADVLTHIPLPQIRHLKIKECWHDKLRSVLQHVPLLETLNVCVELENPNMPITLISPTLNRLYLTIQSEYFYIYQFKFFIIIS